MKRVSPQRFAALAGYARQPMSLVYGEERAYFEHENERVLGLLLRDRTDKDFRGLILARDRRQKFRCVSTTGFHTNQRKAEVELRREMKRIATLPNDEYYQGDEKGKPVDFFASVVPPNRLNPTFARLRDDEFFSPARGIIEEMMRWYEDADGNFVQQFQTTGFDARVWELYLFAAFREMLYEIERTQPAPDFACVNLGAKFFIEAVTVNPTQGSGGIPISEPEIASLDHFDAYRLQYMPIKFGSSLTSKLSKRYWELPHVAGNPLLLAIQDFSAPQSMLRSRSAFETYIYGYAHDWERDPDGKLRILPRKVKAHRWEAKEILSGFFDLTDAENVSAVLFSNSGTISKFNRMGLLAGFGSDRLRMERIGFAIDHDPNAEEPKAFRRLVNDQNYEESWSEGLDVWHNPRAKQPLDPRALPFAAHHRLLPDGQIQSMNPEWHPLSSWTLNLLPTKPDPEV